MDQNFQKIKEIQQILLNNTDLKFKRFLYQQIDFKQRLIGIVGPRGVGKTTLILQYLKEQNKHQENIYFLADNVLLKKGDLINLATDFYLKQGGRVMCIDEIHRYKNWNQELKNIYDTLPDLKIIFSGSSSLDLISGKYDLSRRGVIYHLGGFSFREYLDFEKGIKLKNFSLKQLIKDYQKIAINLFKQDKNILKHFNEYLSKGYYPFYKETNNQELYWQQINNIIDKIIYEDIASFYDLKTQNLITFKQILSFLATTTPGGVNINKLANSLERNHNTISEYLEILEKASLIRFLTNDKVGHSLVRNAKKVYLDNTNLLQAINIYLGKKEEVGTIRELFVLNQLQNTGYIPTFTNQGDFLINGYVLEVGGKNKNIKQIDEIKNSFLVLDDIVIADKQKIPLYLFGFLY